MRNMRQDKIRKEDRKEERRVKKEQAAKQKEDGILRDPEGNIICPVPFVPCSKAGDSLPQSLEEGIKLECTNEVCLFTKHLVHPECFDTLENGLQNILANKGSARGWTEGHRRNNLWTKKGLSLHQKYLNCPCGKGLVKRDEDAWKEREKLLDPRQQKDKKKHIKTKNLPTLQFAKKGFPPPLDLKKAHELDNHFLSSHSPPPSEIYLEDRYGPLKEAAARTRKTTCTSMESSVTSTSRPSITSLPTASIPFLLKPLITPISRPKRPIGFMPIKSPEKPPLMNAERPKTPSTISPPRANTPSSVNKHGRSNTPVSTLRQPSEKESRDVISPIQQLSDTLSPTNTTTSMASIGSLRNYHHEMTSYPAFKDAAVQTDITTFSKDSTIFKETWIKAYSPIELEHDSGIHSIIGSPKFISEALTPMKSRNDWFGNERTITPPPGFGLSDRRKSFVKELVEEENNNKTNFRPIPWDPPVSTEYSLFNGRTIGLGEEILRRLENRTLFDDPVNDYCINCTSN